MVSVGIALSFSACNIGTTQIDQNFAPGIKASAANSLISVSSSTVISGSDIKFTLSLRDDNFNPYISSLPIVSFYIVGGTSTGIIGSVTNNLDGTFSANYTGITAGTPGTIHAILDGSEITGTLPTIQVLNGTYSLIYSTVSLSASSIYSPGQVTATLTTKDFSDNPLTVGGLNVVFSNSGGTSDVSFGSVIDHGDGTYSAPVTGVTAGTPTSISATIQGYPLTSTPPSCDSRAILSL